MRKKIGRFQNHQHKRSRNREWIDISVEPPSTQEVKAAMKALRNGRAPGADQITAEMLK